MAEALKALIDGGPVFIVVAIFFWFGKRFYRKEVEGEIHAAKIAANAAQDEAKKSYTAVISNHASLNKSLTELSERIASHYDAFLEIKALAKNSDENVRKLSGLSSQLAKRHLQLESEIKKLNEELILIRNKK